MKSAGWKFRNAEIRIFGRRGIEGSLVYQRGQSMWGKKDGAYGAILTNTCVGTAGNEQMR